MTEDLDGWWAELQPVLQDRFFAIFPGSPAALNNRLDTHLAVAWPAERSVEEFLDLAAALGVRMIYASGQPFGEEESERLRTVVPPPIPGADDFVRTAELLWSGRLTRVRLMWMFDGVAHHWSREAEWYVSLWQEAAALRQGGQPIVYAEYTAQIHILANSLAAHPSFQKLPTVKQRIREAPRLLPELSAALRRGQIGYRDVEEVAREAWRIYQEEIVPTLESELAGRARRLADQGLSKGEIAGRLGISTNRLNRILGQYGADPHP